MRTIALVNQKGGCGKTTTAISLASCLALEKKRVLLIDLDPQGHAGLGLGIKPEDVRKSIYEVLLGRIKVGEALYVIHENLHIVPSDVVLSAFEQVMSGVEGREYQLIRSLEDLTVTYDHLIIDCPPSIGLLTFNALMACDDVIVPVDPSFFSLHGLEKLLQTIQVLRDAGKRSIPVRILATNIDNRTRYAKFVLKTLREHFSDQCYDTFIHTGTRLKEAAGHGKPITEYDGNSRACRDYRMLTQEVLQSKPAEEAIGDSAAMNRPVEKNVVFNLDAPAHSDVRIAGDFTDWKPESLFYSDALEEPGWRKRFSLKPGSYRYKYLINGQWMADPNNDRIVDDSYGGTNSLITV